MQAIHGRVEDSTYLERDDSLGLGRAMLALFVSSLLMLVVQVTVYALGAEPSSVGGAVLDFVALVVGQVLMLRWCLTWFDWTISLKAAFLAWLVAGVTGFVALGLTFSVVDSAVVALLVVFVVEYLVAGWIVMLTAVPLDEGTPSSRRPAPAPTSAVSWQDDASLYTTDQFREDLQRARAGERSA